MRTTQVQTRRLPCKPARSRRITPSFNIFGGKNEGVFFVVLCRIGRSSNDWTSLPAGGTGRMSAGNIDLNAVTREQLLRVPGMEAAWIDRILDNRPYRSKYDLLNRLVIPDYAYRQFQPIASRWTKNPPMRQFEPRNAGPYREAIPQHMKSHRIQAESAGTQPA